MEMSLGNPGCVYVLGDWRWRLEIGDWRLEIGDWRWDLAGVAVGGAVWRVRFRANEVTFDFSFLLFLFGFLSVICFRSLFFSFPSFSFLLMHHISIFLYFHLFIFSCFNFSFFHIFIFSKYIAPVSWELIQNDVSENNSVYKVREVFVHWDEWVSGLACMCVCGVRLVVGGWWL
jgi:hypothetical protein